MFNLGSGTKTYLSNLIDTLIDVYGKTGKVKVEEVGSTQGDILGCYADISKISNQLGYNPKFNLNQGIELFKDWVDSA